MGTNIEWLKSTRLPSREPTYPTLEKEKSPSKIDFSGDMLVPRRVSWSTLLGLVDSALWFLPKKNTTTKKPPMFFLLKEFSINSQTVRIVNVQLVSRFMRLNKSISSYTLED